MSSIACRKRGVLVWRAVQVNISQERSFLRHTAHDDLIPERIELVALIVEFARQIVPDLLGWTLMSVVLNEVFLAAEIGVNKSGRESIYEL